MKTIDAWIRAAAAVVLLLTIPVQTFAQGAAADFELRRANVVRPDTGRALTAPSQAAHASIVGNYLRSRGASTATVGSLRQVATGKSRKDIVHLRMEQQFAGLTVYGSYVKAAINPRGELVHLIERIAPVPSAALVGATIGEQQALAAAMARVHSGEPVTFREIGRSGNVATFAGGRFFHSDPTVERVAVPRKDGSMAVGYLVQTWSEKDNLLHHTLVGGDGRVLAVELRTANDTYRVFTEDPLKAAQVDVAGPGAGNAESPSGWLGSGTQTTINISGNNANAYLDTNNDNRADSGGTTVGNGVFQTSADLTVAPSTTGNRAVSVQNLFYFNNVMHDVLYRHGFNEVAGNFQIDNFGNGGRGRDPVKAEAQDGGGTDNANFATPRDGSSPRMQMYLWTGAGATHEVVEGGNTYAAMGAQFGPALSTTGIAGAIQLVTDAGGTSATDGCETITTNLSGLIALVDRGTCNFTVKVANAQSAGAIGVIVVNNVNETEIFTMGGTERRIRIPSVMISQNDGAVLRSDQHAVAMHKKAIQPLQIDGSLDADIVFHEYGHGLTWRMIGGMDGPLAGAIGEGASDVVAFLMNGDDRIAEYSASNPLGIRRAPYTNYPRKYGEVTGIEVHDDGEIYAAILWKLKELFHQDVDTLFGYFVDGMNYTPATPAFEDMRNGMLQSASPNTAHCARIWDAFAQFGVGVGASGVALRPSGVLINPTFAARTDCSY